MPKYTCAILFSFFNNDLLGRDCCLIESSVNIRHVYRVSMPLEKVILTLNLLGAFNLS